MICKFDPCAVRLSAPPNIEPDQKTLWQSVFPAGKATGALIRAYVWLGWEPIAVIEGGVVNYIRADHIGRPVFATNATGAKGWTASYLPFGGVRTTTGTPITARFPPLVHLTDALLGNGPMVPIGIRPAPELDAGLRSDNGAVFAGRPAGIDR